jgi:hypothetical protein
MMQNAKSAILAALFAGCSIASMPLAAQSGFEGVIEFKDYANRTQTMVQTSKGSMVRIDTGARHDEVMIIDVKARTMTVLVPEAKMYMVNVLPSPGESAKPNANHPARFTATGQSETVAGVKCEIYSTDVKAKNPKGDRSGQLDVCMAKGMGFAMLGPMGLGASGTVYQDLAAKDLYVLKAWETEGGKRKVSMEATKIEKKSVPASAFQIPADYKKMDMPAMPRRPPKS